MAVRPVVIWPDDRLRRVGADVVAAGRQDLTGRPNGAIARGAVVAATATLPPDVET